ncbi:hypothetical protein F8M41_016532 [Gigaspora margarita]|uniref:Uncharacterized protein n=1 Tax=Gigaspora margarita TaxID=4874 RepID=A0A8H4B385_GIGMA|nr:hypothetical protein F8M41_016532 [Gigaspora margarita]
MEVQDREEFVTAVICCKNSITVPIVTWQKSSRPRRIVAAASRNILIHQGKPKIADFGASKQISRKSTT